MAALSRSTKAKTGRAQRKQTPAARAKQPSLARYYGKRLSAVQPGDFEFELTLMRGRGTKPFALDDFVQSFEWADDETAMSGNVQLVRPDADDAGTLPVGRGHRIRCRVKWGGHWFEVWTMRCDAPETNVEPEQVTVSVDLHDDMDIVARGKRHYLHRKRKGHPHGYFGHEVLRDEAKREGIRLGAVVKCTSRMTKIDVTGSFLDLATAIYKHEHEKTGLTYVLRMHNGRFEVVHYRRNRILYVLGDQIRTATVHRDPKKDKPVTLLVGKGRVGKGKAAKTVRHTEYRREMVARFGYMRRVKDYGHVDSAGALRSKMKRDLADEYKVDTSVDVEVAGIPFIRRGDGAQLVLASEGFSGVRSFVYCTGARHQVQGGSYTSSFSFDLVDPFLKDQERREKDARAKARRKRKARKRGS
jgi:hypothetical protein